MDSFGCEKQKPQIKVFLWKEKLPEDHAACTLFIMLKNRQNKITCCLGIRFYVTKLHTHTRIHTHRGIINIKFRAVSSWDLRSGVIRGPVQEKHIPENNYNG